MSTPAGVPQDYFAKGSIAYQAEDQDEFEKMLYAQNTEIESFGDLMSQRGTPIPALFSLYYKFIQNPSTVSIETFKRMVDTDDTIGSGVDFLTTCLVARLGRYNHPKEEITEFVNKALDLIEGGSVKAFKEILSATWAGMSVTEKCWGDDPIGFIVKKLVTLPPQTILFETERTGEVTKDGILQYQRNWYPYALSPGLGYFGGLFASGVTAGGGVAGNRPDAYSKFGDLPFPIRTANPLTYLSIRIPKQKVIHYSLDTQGNFGNPYGRSMLRRAYKYYVMKDAILQMLAVALDRKGTPATVVWADPNTTLEDPNKNPDGSNRGRQSGLGIRADQAARNVFRNMHNDSVFVLPGKKGEVFDIEVLAHNSNATEFIAALDFCNKSIMRAILVPSLIFTNGDGTGSFALGQEHAKTFDKILDSMLAGFKHTIIQQLVKELIQYNFPRDMWEKDGMGDFVRQELSQEEIDKQMDGFEKAVNLGAMSMNELQDLNTVREAIRLEPREEVFPQQDPLAFGDPLTEEAEGPPSPNGEQEIPNASVAAPKENPQDKKMSFVKKMIKYLERFE